MQYVTLLNNMNILSDTNRPYPIESLSAPIGVSHFWSFSGQLLDFKLEDLTYLEETTGPTVRIRCQNMELNVPASWHVLAVDRETFGVDCIPIPAIATFEHDVLLFSADDCKPTTSKLSIVSYFDKASVIHPMIVKGAAMVHPIGLNPMHGKLVHYGIVIGPHDLGRWISGKAVGDLLS